MTGERDGTRPATGHGRVAPVAGVALLSLTIALVAIGAVLLFGGDDFGRIVWGLPGVSGLWALGFSVAGYPIARRHPANPVGWCLMVAGVAAGVTLLGFGLGVSDAADRGWPALMLVSAWVFSVGALSSAVVLFPSGSRRRGGGGCSWACCGVPVSSHTSRTRTKRAPDSSACRSGWTQSPCR